MSRPLIRSQALSKVRTKVRFGETCRRALGLRSKDRIKYRLELPVDRARMLNLSNNNSKIVLSNGDHIGIGLSRESRSLRVLRRKLATWGVGDAEIISAFGPKPDIHV